MNRRPRRRTPPARLPGNARANDRFALSRIVATIANGVALERDWKLGRSTAIRRIEDRIRYARKMQRLATLGSGRHRTAELGEVVRVLACGMQDVIARVAKRLPISVRQANIGAGTCSMSFGASAVPLVNGTVEGLQALAGDLWLENERLKTERGEDRPLADQERGRRRKISKSMKASHACRSSSRFGKA